MTYIKDSLLKDEQILYHIKPHFIVFYTVLLWIALAIFTYRVVNNPLLIIVLLLIGLVSFISDFISYYCSEYVITNRRVLMKVGFIRRKSLEIFLDRVEGIYVEQGILGRILNFGTIIIAGVGGTKNPFFFIPDPLKFRGILQEHMSKNNGKY